MHQNARFIGLLLGSLVAMGQAPLPGRANAAATSFRADLKTHTALRVSSSQLRFTVDSAADTPRTTIDFTAAGRTYTGGEVLLTVESVGSLQAAGSRTIGEPFVVYEGEEGASGTLSAGPHVVAHWVGSGVRAGAVSFTLHGAAPGVYLLSVKFVLSAP